MLVARVAEAGTIGLYTTLESSALLMALLLHPLLRRVPRGQGETYAVRAMAAITAVLAVAAVRGVFAVGAVGAVGEVRGVDA